MTLPKTHFYVRSKQDAFPENPGRHPVLAIEILDGLAVIASCSPKDQFRKAVARSILAGRKSISKGTSFFKSVDTLEDILKRAGVPRKLLRVADMVRAEAAFERSLEA